MYQYYFHLTAESEMKIELAFPCSLEKHFKILNLEIQLNIADHFSENSNKQSLFFLKFAGANCT